MNTTRAPELGTTFWISDEEDGICETTIIEIHSEHFNPDFGQVFTVTGDVDDEDYQIAYDSIYNAWHDITVDLSDFDWEDEE